MKKITTKPDGTTETIEGSPWELWQYEQFRLVSVTINHQPVIIPTIQPIDPIQPYPYVDPLTPFWYKITTDIQC